MNQPLPPIHPDFPDTESFRDLRFHLQELHWDLKSLVKEVESLSPAVPNSAEELRTIRYGLPGVTAEIEHDASYHLAEALKLAGNGFLKPELSDLGEQLAAKKMDWDDDFYVPAQEGEIDNPLALHQGIQELASQLRLAQEQADKAAFGNLQELENGLENLAVLLGSEAWFLVEDLYLPACRLHRAADPVEAAEDDYWKLIATPLHEDYHPLARTLDTCPRCGAAISQDDRTLDGSYCESCRSRWFNSLPPSGELND